jgi:HEAT repeat protein
MIQIRPGMTAKEFMDEANKDPEFVAEARRRERESDRRHAEYAALERPLVERLREAGYDVDSVWDLFNKKLDYHAAIPMLMEWLPQATDRRVKESLVRALSVRWAKPQAAPLLISQFRDLDDDPQSGLRWAIGNALDVVADDSFCADLVELARDRRYGSAREMIVLALGKMKKARPVEVLIELLDDEVVAGHAVAALARLKAPEAAEALQPFLHHPKTWIRQEAGKALGIRKRGSR